MRVRVRVTCVRARACAWESTGHVGTWVWEPGVGRRKANGWVNERSNWAESEERAAGRVERARTRRGSACRPAAAVRVRVRVRERQRAQRPRNWEGTWNNRTRTNLKSKEWERRRYARASGAALQNARQTIESTNWLINWVVWAAARRRGAVWVINPGSGRRRGQESIRQQSGQLMNQINLGDPGQRNQLGQPTGRSELGNPSNRIRVERANARVASNARGAWRAAPRARCVRAATARRAAVAARRRTRERPWKARNEGA